MYYQIACLGGYINVNWLRLMALRSGDGSQCFVRANRPSYIWVDSVEQCTCLTVEIAEFSMHVGDSDDNQQGTQKGLTSVQ